MNSKNRLLSIFKATLLTLIVGVNMTACGAGPGIEHWKEEVKLGNGKVIVVEREAIYEGGGDELAFNHGGSKIKAYVIRLADPNDLGKMIEWHSTKVDFQTYPEVPLVLDIISGQPTIFSLVAISSGCEVYSKYLYIEGKWLEEPLPEVIEVHFTNLLFGSQKGLPQLLGLEQKMKRNTDTHYRDALKYVGPNLKVCG